MTDKESAAPIPATGAGDANKCKVCGHAEAAHVRPSCLDCDALDFAMHPFVSVAPSSTLASEGTPDDALLRDYASRFVNGGTALYDREAMQEIARRWLDAPAPVVALRWRHVSGHPPIEVPVGAFVNLGTLSPLPCPFCGSAVSVHPLTSEDITGENGGASFYSWWKVACEKCGIMSSGAGSERLAIALWNRRVPVAPGVPVSEIPTAWEDRDVETLNRLV